MPSPKVVLITRFEIPAEFMLPGGPKHKIQHGFTAERVRYNVVSTGMNPLRTNAEHKLRFMGQGPRLLKQKVSIPFCRAATEKPRNAPLKFQPVLYRRKFNRDGGTEARSTAFEAPASSSPKLDNCGRFLIDSTERRRFQNRGTKTPSKRILSRSRQPRPTRYDHSHLGTRKLDAGGFCVSREV